MSSKRSLKGVKEQWKKQFKKPSVKKRKVARVKGAIPVNPELKFVDLAVANYVCDTTGTLTLLNGIAQGDDYTSRSGRQATMKSVHVHRLVRPYDQSTADSLAALYIVWDNAPKGTIATIAEVLNAVNSISFPLIDNANRFTILREWHAPIGLVSSTATQSFANSPTTHAVDLYVPLEAVTQFAGTGATIASIQNGALYLISVGSLATTASAMAELATRVRFSDPE